MDIINCTVTIRDSKELSEDTICGHETIGSAVAQIVERMIEASKEKPITLTIEVVIEPIQE